MGCFFYVMPFVKGESADFGIACVFQDSAHLTVTGMSVGTPIYMGAEQAHGETSIDGRSDLYSLACVAYELLTGEPPYTGPFGSVPHET